MEHMVLSEYKDLLERKLELEIKLQSLVQGYISNKTIKGKTTRPATMNTSPMLTCTHRTARTAPIPAFRTKLCKPYSSPYRTR